MAQQCANDPCGFYVSSSTVLVFEFVLLIWALATMGSAGFGDTISSKPAVQDTSKGWAMLHGIISYIGGISAGILNQNDYARFSRTPKDAITAQLICPPIYGIITPIVGILVTAATQERYGAPLWSLPSLLSAVQASGGPRSRAAVFFAGAALVVSQFGINIPGNALSGGFDFAALFPTYINIRRGAYITALLSMVTQPWQLLSSASTFLSVLSSFSVFLGPMIGLMISSYYIVNKQRINVDHLFVGNSESVYWFSKGVNWTAVVAVCSEPITNNHQIMLSLCSGGALTWFSSGCVVWHRASRAFSVQLGESYSSIPLDMLHFADM